jgi:hypothetical protein
VNIAISNLRPLTNSSNLIKAQVIWTPKKELIGQRYLKGQLFTQEPIEVFDHDWLTLATGVAIHHGLYDINVGYI